MPDVPAMCRTCGTVFRSGIFAENSRNMTFAGCTAGPCPRCGGMGDIPDGVYDFVGDTVRVAAASGYSREQLKRVAAVVLHAREAGTSAGEVVAELEREAPELAEVAKRLLVPKTPADLTGWLMLLLMVVQLLLIRQPGPDVTEEDVSRITEQAVERAVGPSAPAAPSVHAASHARAKRPPPPPRKQLRAKKARCRR